MRDVEKSEKDAELPATRVPPPPADKPPRDSAIIYFDVETACRTKNCEILQLAAVSKHSSFSSYITPTFDIATSATAVHGLRVAYNNEEKRCLSKKGVLLETCPKEEAFNNFLSFLESMKHPCILIGHNATVFDTPRLLYQISLCERELGRGLKMPIFFADSLPSLKKETWLHKSKTLGSIYQHVTGNSFNAHDALEDSTALQQIMDDERLNSCLSAIVDNAVHIKAAFYDMKVKAETSQRVSTFKGNMDTLLSSYMVEKMAKAGLTYNAIKNVHAISGMKGVVALLTGARDGREARVTSNKEVLTKVVFFLIKQ